MKVILLQDVARIGRRFEVKDVPDGHALNMLIPKGWAQPATPENVKRLTNRVAKAESVKSEANETFAATLAKLKETAVTMKVEANEQGHLFKSIKAADIAAYISKEVGHLTKEQISLKTPIKEVGEYELTASQGTESGIFTLVVTA